MTRSSPSRPDRLFASARACASIGAAGSGTLGEPIGAPAPKRYRILPVTRGQGDLTKTPILVEVGADRYVVHEPEADRKAEYPAIERGSGPEGSWRVDPGLLQFLTSINQRRRDAYLLFLIRPDGIGAFEHITDYCDAHYWVRGGQKTPERLRPAESRDRAETGAIARSPVSR